MSQFVSIKGSMMHYEDHGSGDPILFLHGMPTSSYVWRHIFPKMSVKARCVAPDLIGMGKSDKPDIAYHVFDHIAYIDAFIEALALKNITLVLHGWGSVIGFDYARRHPDNVKAIAFYEAYLQPIQEWSQLSLPVQQLATLLKRPGASYRAIVKQNYFIEKLLPRSVIRPLTESEMEVYRAPFVTEESRKPLWQFLQDLPLGDGPEEVIALMALYSEWLTKTMIPKLMLYAIPGFITTMASVCWARDNLQHLTLSELDESLHMAQESVPDVFAKRLCDWYATVA